jgi:hypothetical protein
VLAERRVDLAAKDVASGERPHVVFREHVLPHFQSQPHGGVYRSGIVSSVAAWYSAASASTMSR